MGESLVSRIEHNRDDPKLREYFGDMGPNPIFWREGKWCGNAWAMSPRNQQISINPTGFPGFISKVYFGTIFEIKKDKYNVEKVNEAIDVSPEHQQYWQITLAQKEALEQKIKQALMGISSSIADLELVKTDLERYEEFLNWIKDLESDDEKKRKEAMLVLKSFFVDQVDYYAGGGGAEGPGRLSMAFMRNRNIMPTIVQDFMMMESEGDLKEGGKLAHLPEVEKQVLRTKWKAFEDWLEVFRSNVERRVEHLRTLVRSREKTIEEMRESAKPLILRYKMIVDALSSPKMRKEMPHIFVRVVGHAISMTTIDLWVWKVYPLFDEFPVPGELRAKVESEINPYNDWTKENLIFHSQLGLIADYPWITEEWVEDKKSGILSKMGWKGRYYHYYIFMPITLEKVNIRFADGGELEDGVFKVTNWALSANVMFTKLLELEAMKEENEIYVDDMLGLKHEIPGNPVVFYKKSKKKRENQEIVRKHYDRITKFVFRAKNKKGDEKLIELPRLSKYTVGELEEKLGKDVVQEFIDLKEAKEEKSLLDSIKRFFEFFGIDITPYRFKGPYGHFNKDFANKYIAKPMSSNFNYVSGTILNKSAFGKILKPA